MLAKYFDSQDHPSTLHIALLLYFCVHHLSYHSLVFKAFNSCIQSIMFLSIFNILNAKCFCSKSWYSVSGDRWSWHAFLLSWINACEDWQSWRLKCSVAESIYNSRGAVSAFYYSVALIHNKRFTNVIVPFNSLSLCWNSYL